MLVAVLEGSLEQTALAAQRVRADGNVPLIADPKWTPEFWQSQVAKFDGQEVPAEAAWAAFSGGSTGQPRVVLRTHESWSLSFEPLNQLLGLTSDDVFYVPGSTASSMTLFSLAHVAALGAKLTVGAGERPNNKTSMDDDLHDATVFHGTSTALTAALDHLERQPASITTHPPQPAQTPTTKLRAALVGGEPMSPQLRTRAEALGIQVVSYYGAAELSFVAMDTDGTGFRPFPGVELEVRTGVLWSRSPYQSLGYWGGATGAFQKDPHGWATVQDLAEVESIAVDGQQETRYTILGRADGAILTGGATVIPEEVERQLNQLDGIAQSLVFGLPNENTGALIAALIERSDFEPAPSLAQLKVAASLLLSHTHQPRIWYEATQIPRTPAGKLARSVVADLAHRKELKRLD